MSRGWRVLLTAALVLAGCSSASGEPVLDVTLADGSCALPGDCVVLAVTNIGTATGGGACVVTAVARAGGIVTASVEVDPLAPDESVRLEVRLDEQPVGDITPRCVPGVDG